MRKDKIIYFLDKAIEWSLYLLIFCLPFSKSIIEITITVALVAWVSKKLLLKDFSLRKTPLNVPLFAFFIASFISLFNADNKFFVSYALITKCLKWIILYFIIVEEINSDIKIKNTLKIAFLSAIVIMIDSYIQYYITHVDLLRDYPSFKFKSPLSYDGFDRGFPTGSFPFPNDLSAWMLVIVMPLFSVIAFARLKKYHRIALGLFASAFIYLFYLANTRSAWLGFAIAFSLITAMKKMKLLIIAVLAILLITPFLPRQKVKDILATNSFTDRIFMWETGWKIFMRHPIIGNGLNTFFNKFKEFREDADKGKRGSYAHNGYLQIAADTGIAGLSIFLFIIYRIFRSGFIFIRRSKDRFYSALAIGLCGGLLAFLVQSFFDTNLHSLPLVALFWFNTGFLMSLRNAHAQQI